MSFAIGSAGMNAAVQRLDAASTAIARESAQTSGQQVEDVAAAQGVQGLDGGAEGAQGARGDRPPPPPGGGKGGGGPSGGPPGGGGGQAGADVDVANALVEQISASASFMANLNTVETVGEMLAALLEVDDTAA